MAEVEEAYRDGMAADRVWWASRDERWFACGGYSIALRCTRGDDEAVVDGRLESWTLVADSAVNRQRYGFVAD